jgi:hypothetical protein
MSYLGPLRLHFAGRFQALPSTVNNDVRHFNSATFEPRFQKSPDGSWEPDGTGAFRLLGCNVTTVSYAGGRTSARDRVVGMSIADAGARVAAKIVDLDPQQQLVSQLWGLVVRLTDGTSDLFSGPFAVAPFSDFWLLRAKGKGALGDMGSGCFYQSVIGPVTWGDVRGSRFLQELREAAPEGLLSIKFNVDGYNQLPDSSLFSTGRIVGTIGPARPDQPKSFVAGRHLLPRMSGISPVGDLNFMPAAIDPKTRRIYADFGNAIPTTHPGGPMQSCGRVELGYLDAGNAFHSLGRISYLKPDWYATTAGVAAFPLTPAQLKAVSRNRLAVTQDGKVVLMENFDGLYARADDFVFRLDPGQSADVRLWATQYGKPLARATIRVYHDPSGLQAAAPPGDPSLGSAPPVGVPRDAIRFPKHVRTDRRGIARLTIEASNPKNPRRYIDGQVYGVRYLLSKLHKRVANDPSFGINPFDFVSVLVFNAYRAPKKLTWNHLQPIFQLYANLFPVMKNIVDLSSYESVAANARLLAFAFGLPDTDPNYMPVTRDLSPAKRAAILKWLTTLGPDGKPIRGPVLATPKKKSIKLPPKQKPLQPPPGDIDPRWGAKTYAASTRGPVRIPRKKE